jgi:uncharacterized CHY-type Zn-finger protein
VPCRNRAYYLTKVKPDVGALLEEFQCCVRCGEVTDKLFVRLLPELDRRAPVCGTCHTDMNREEYWRSQYRVRLSPEITYNE